MFGKKPIVIQHPRAYELYEYHLGDRFDAGVPAECFRPKFALPVVSFRGAGRVAGFLRAFQAPQVWYRQQVGVNGVGGVQTGGIGFTPLLESDELG